MDTCGVEAHANGGAMNVKRCDGSLPSTTRCPLFLDALNAGRSRMVACRLWSPFADTGRSKQALAEGCNTRSRDCRHKDS